MIARALAQETPLIVLDEPFSFLDVAARIEILGMLGRLARDHGKGILFSTHDFSTLRQYADKVILLQQAILKVGTPAEVLRSPEFQSVFHLNLEGGDPA